MKVEIYEQSPWRQDAYAHGLAQLPLVNSWAYALKALLPCL